MGANTWIAMAGTTALIRAMARSTAPWICVILGACGTPASVDAGSDAAGDAMFDAARMDAAADAADASIGPSADVTIATDAVVDAALIDAPADASPDAPSTDAAVAMPMLVLAAVNTSYGFEVSSFDGTSWASVAAVGGGAYAVSGGGVTTLAGGGALAVVGSTTGMPSSSTWSGSWQPAMSFGSSIPLLSAPATAPAGAFVATQAGTVGQPVSLATFNGSSWTTGEMTGVAGDDTTFPAVATTSSGDPLVVDRVGTHYVWSLRSGGTWSSVGNVPGIVPPDPSMSAFPSVRMLRQPGVDRIVAAFAVAGASIGTGSLSAATFASGAWTAPVPVAPDLRVSAGSLPIALAPLRDGRIALASIGALGDVSVAFFDGTAWTSPRVVPGVIVTRTSVAVAIADCVTSGAAMELVFIDGASHLTHTRLTDATAWAWSSPATVDASQTYSLVAIAAVP